MNAVRLSTKKLHSLEDALLISPGLTSLHEEKIRCLASMRRGSDVAFHCEKISCDAVRLDVVLTGDLHPLYPFPGINEAKHFKSDYFLQGGVIDYDKKLVSKAVAEAVLRLPNSILPFYLRS